MPKNYKTSKKGYEHRDKKNGKEFTDSYLNDIAFHTSGKPQRDEGKVEDGLSVKSMRGLPHNSYSFMADPYTAALPSSEEYPILTAFNKTVGAYYGGVRNLDGGNVQQYANSVRSKLLKYYDFARIKVEMNYQYIRDVPSNTSGSEVMRGSAIIDEMRRAIAESTSILQSTTFTQMAIYDYAIVTDMQMGSAPFTPYTPVTGNTSQTGLKAYEHLDDVIYGASRYYQEFWLRLLGVLDWHNSFRLKMGNMIRSSWNRETPNLNALFGLFKKKSFLSLIDSLNLAFPGEWIDREFAMQAAKTCLMPSRRSNSITDPTLEVQTMIAMPTRFMLVAKIDGKISTDASAVIFDNTRDLVYPFPGAAGTTMSFETATEEIMDILSAQDTMRWARQPETRPGDDTARYNMVKYRLDVIQRCVTSFKTLFNDVRQVFIECAKPGIVSWYKGFRPAVVKDTDAANFRNLIVDDIYRMCFGGSTEVKFDDATKRWRTFSIWNMYDGIPEYDVWSGGSFLTFSFKKLNMPTDQDYLAGYLPEALTPHLENVTGDEQQTPKMLMRLTSRDGNYAIINQTEVTMNKHIIYSRLVPLTSQQNEVLRVAYFGVNKEDSDYTSTLYKTLTQVCGTCCVGRPTTDNDFEYDYSLDPDVIAIYQIEIEDITNDMIKFARVNSPFRGTSDTVRTLGFQIGRAHV